MHFYTANVVHEPWRIVGLELQHGTKDVALQECSRPGRFRPGSFSGFPRWDQLDHARGSYWEDEGGLDGRVPEPVASSSRTEARTTGVARNGE